VEISQDFVAFSEYMNFKGEVIATPTDTIYGLAALANNTKAVTKIYDIKGL
jgi:tRNA A37 threonylcarbamoyladenosine synthetase subunit TsaC/SUA5/YrdC